MTHQQQSELLTAIGRLFDGSLDQRGVEELALLLTDDAKARQLYVDFVALSVDMAWACGHGPNQPQPSNVDVLPPILVPTTTDASPVIGFLGSVINLAANWVTSPKLLAVGVAGGLLTYFAILGISLVLTRAFHAQQSLPQSLANFSGASARIGTAQDARWRSGQPTIGESVENVPLELTEGLVGLTLGCGAQVVVQAPATFKVLSANRLQLDHGKLAAHVPPKAIGFTVVTDSAEIVDLGTEFGVEVDRDGRTDVHVLKGAVAIKTVRGSAGTSANTAKVSAGQAVRVEAAGEQSTSILFDGDSFASALRMGAVDAQSSAVSLAAPKGLTVNVAAGGIGWVGPGSKGNPASLNDQNTGTQVDASDYAAVVFPKVETVNKVIFEQFGTYVQRGFELQIANVPHPDPAANSDWTTVQSFADVPIDGQYSYSLPGTYTTAGMRLLTTDNSNRDGLTRCVEFWAFQNYRNLALDATVSTPLGPWVGWTSTILKDEVLAGPLQTYTTNLAANGIVELNWAAPQSIGAIAIHGGAVPGAERLINYEIQFWDGSAWVVCRRIRGNQANFVVNDLGELTTTGLRLNILAADNDDGLAQLTEIMVFPAATSGK